MRRAPVEDLPAGWTATPLKYLATSSGGMTPSKDKPQYWDGDVPWVTPKDMKRPLLADSQDHVSAQALTETGLKMHPPEGVMVVTRGMILAHTFPVARNAVPVTVNQDMKVLRPGPTTDARYLAWLLQGLAPVMLSLTDESAHGTKALRTDQWENLPVPMPKDRGLQERLANFLDEQTARIDALIAEKEALRSAVKEYFDARLGTAVVQGLGARAALMPAEAYGYERIRADWRLVPLKHLVSFAGGMTPSKDNDLFWAGDIPWVSPKDMKRFVLMRAINPRGTSLVTRTSLPHLLRAPQPQVLMLSPPLNMEERWFAPNVAYTMAKYGMSMCVLGMAGEFRGRVGFNALWPRTFIGTAAVRNILGGEATVQRTRRPEIMADAAHLILTRDRHFSGHFCVDEDLLRANGVSDFSGYSDCPPEDLIPDSFI